MRRLMARSVAAPGVRPGMNPRTAGIIASYLEVLARVIYAQPNALLTLLEGSTPALHAFVDHWLALAAFRCAIALPTVRDTSMLVHAKPATWTCWPE